MDFAALKLSIKNKRNEAASRLVDPGVPDYAAYQHMKGFIHGMDAAFSILEKFLNEESEDSDD